MKRPRPVNNNEAPTMGKNYGAVCNADAGTDDVDCCYNETHMNETMHVNPYGRVGRPPILSPTSSNGSLSSTSLSSPSFRWKLPTLCLLFSCWLILIDFNGNGCDGVRKWKHIVEAASLEGGFMGHRTTGSTALQRRLDQVNNEQPDRIKDRQSRSLVDVFDMNGIDGDGNGTPAPSFDNYDAGSRPGPPAELNVTSPMRQTGNPLIQQSLPLAFSVDLSILPTASRSVLLTQLEPAFEDYLKIRYQNLIELQAAVFGSESAASIELEDIDLTLAIIDQAPGTTRRRLGSSSYRRALQQTSDQITIQGVGEIDYNLQVDGSNPTPDEVKATWSAVFEEDLMTQPRIEEVIGDAGIESVVRVDQVSVLDPSQVVDTSGTSQGNATDEGDEVTRPSTLSIVFGFLLVGIATIGLVVYAFIFYRKRQKRLRKKRMMQESISYPSGSVAAARATSAGASVSSASNATRNVNNVSGVNSSMTSNNSGLPPTPALPTNPMIVSRQDEEYSDETSYKGLESSIGSEDPSDSFAKELQLAASLDQQAWDEFQKKKEALDHRNRMIEASSPGSKAGANPRDTPDLEPEEMKTSTSASRASNTNPSISRFGSTETGESDAGEQGGEFSGTIGFARSFPYGDETADDERHSEVSQNRQWEPYNSQLPPSPNLTEEKKDDLSPTSFFAQQLQSIETDLATFGRAQENGNRGDILRSATSTSDDVAASDVVSEVDELSKYVRRYERRRDRRLQREHMLHDRLKTARAGTLSIGMDGKVYVPDQADNGRGVVNSYSSSLSPPSVPSRDKEDPPLIPSDTRSFTETYKKSASRRSRDDNLAFISDDEGSDEEINEEPGSERSQRLGISPFKASAPDQRYLSSSPGKGNGIQSSPIRADLSISQSSHKSRLADLRKTDAIIDSSQSDVNTNTAYDRDQMMAAMEAVPQMKPANISSNGQISRLNVPQGVGTSPRVKPTTNKRFNKLRGLFEQKTNAQPEPIYPPTEHWQYGIHKNEGR